VSVAGNRRDGSSRMIHERDSNNNHTRHPTINHNLDKSITSTGSGQQSPVSSNSDKSCDEQLLLMQQLPLQPRSIFMTQAHEEQQQHSDRQGLETTSTSAITMPVKSLKQEQCESNQIPFDPHSFTNYSPFAINTLMLHPGFADNSAAFNAYYASQLPQTAFIPSSSSSAAATTAAAAVDYYHHHQHHPSMYASPSTAL
jgi:hypothetical protein